METFQSLTKTTVELKGHDNITNMRNILLVQGSKQAHPETFRTDEQVYP